MFGAAHLEVLLPVLLIAILVFGTKRLPEMGGAVGKTIKEFKHSMKEVNEDSAQAPAQLPPAAAVPVQIPAAPTATVASTTPAASATTVTETVAE